MELVASRGVRAVTLAAVGEAAGYSRGIVTHQFGSRSGLLDALTLDLQNRFVPPDTDDVTELVDAYLEAFETRPLDTRVYAVMWAEAQAGDPDLKEAVASLRLTRRERARNLTIPGALPGALVGFRQSLGVAWLALIVAEQINADAGLGYLINNARDFLRTDIIVVGLVAYAILGLLTDALVRAGERRALRWQAA